MPKRRLSFKIRIPEYRAPRTAWRREIHHACAAAMREKGIVYSESDRLEVCLRLYLVPAKLAKVDVDNRLKDVMDALQGHVGGQGVKRRSLRALIPNDSQIFRASVEKLEVRAGMDNFGEIIVRKYKPGTKFKRSSG